MRLLPCGERALLVELDDAEQRRRLDAVLRREPLAGVVEHVPGMQTVLVRVADPADLAPVAERLTGLDLDDPAATDADEPELVVPVTYDGDDLAEVAALLGVSEDEVVERHTGQTWRVDLVGFAPGFGYLVGERGGLTVPRRTSPRARIPAGAVALAGEWSGVYTSASPGGWQLIGRTELAMWDPSRPEPALLTPGRRVRFVRAGEAR